MENYMIARFDEIDAVRCPCGSSRRGFVNHGNRKATMHVVDVQQDAKVHYHKKLTEIYFILEGEGQMELDGELVPIQPGTCVLIPPGVVHRAVGRMTILNIVYPKFDPTDEVLVDA